MVDWSKVRPEAALDDPHAGNTETIQEAVNVRVDFSKILHNKPEPRERLLYRAQKSRPRNPLPRAGSRRMPRADFPDAGVSAEMIKPDFVVQRSCPSYPFEMP